MPGVKTSIVSNGTEALPPDPLLLVAGATRVKLASVTAPVTGFRDGRPGRATTTTGPLKANCEAA